ncbi:phosphate:H+ symporter [Penicillium diatomitis]|uniref:Phosphate:H+ symporter n=1 Tax=Penicillium diatomitis TaxID=2819901 RepID=A0A9X0BJC6_9EURO|nr:phosphate:H+ symporter [Penicillium diatomitis]KAJ5469329.1 phosphate:H+ symporter [Penicillium diatomitis]
MAGDTPWTLIGRLKYCYDYLKAVLLTSILMFFNAYDILLVNLAVSLLGVLVWEGIKVHPEPKSAYFEISLKAAASTAFTVNQLLFGWLAGKVGHEKMYVLVSGIIVSVILAQILGTVAPGMETMATLLFWRLAWGIANVWGSPLAPDNQPGHHADMMPHISVYEALAFLAVPPIFIALALGSARSAQMRGESDHESGLGQIIIDKLLYMGQRFAAIVPCAVLFYRMTTLHVVEGPPYPRGYVPRAPAPSPVLYPIRTIARECFAEWKNFQELLGTAISVCFLDLAIYGLGMNGSIIRGTLGSQVGHNDHETFCWNAVVNLIVVAAASVPGYWITLGTMVVLARRPSFLPGLLLLSGTLFVIGVNDNPVQSLHNGLLTIYLVVQYAYSFQPKTILLLLPNERFQTCFRRSRTLRFGVAAICGKLCAIIIQTVLEQCGYVTTGNEQATMAWLNLASQFIGGFFLCGILATLFLPIYRDNILEELAEEFEMQRLMREWS